MFRSMLSHPNIKIMLNTDYREIKDFIPYNHMIYTGPIDTYFDHKLGPLPYRSLEFVFETHDQPQMLDVGTENYPNDYAYTRRTEMKHLSGQKHDKTTLCYEFSKAEGDPYYPIPREENKTLYASYKELAEKESNTTFVGRLATYKYYNMDQVVAQALKTYRTLSHDE